jgi:hypothetical protein
LDESETRMSKNLDRARPEKSEAQRRLEQTIAAKGDYLRTPTSPEIMAAVMKEIEEEEASRASDHLIVWPQSD